MCAVAELEVGMISTRTKQALAEAKRKGKNVGGLRHNVIGKDAKGNKIYGDVACGNAKIMRIATRARQALADQRASDVAPAIRALQEAGATSLRAIAAGLNEKCIPTARGNGEWTATQVMRVLERL
jgi:DNA invertase Pin-like site-specific DNA recombinase